MNDITIIINNEGKITTKNPVSTEKISEYAGEWSLGPSTSYLLVFERTGEQHQTQVSQSSMIGKILFSGLINEGSLLEFVNFLGENSKTGVLVVIHEDTKKSIFFKNGQISYATSNMSEDRIGEVLYRYGLVTKAQLEEALKDKSVRIGEKLIQMDILNVTDLYKAIKYQVEEICYSTFIFTKGNFYFYELANNDLIPSHLHLTTRNILFEGVRRMDEMTYFKKKLPSPFVVPEIMPDVTVSQLSVNEKTIFELVDGKSNIKILARVSRLGLFETTRIIFHLMQGGYIKILTTTMLVDETYSGIVNLKKLIRAYNKVFQYIGNKSSELKPKLKKDLETFISKLEDDLAILFKDVKILDNLNIDKEKLILNIKDMPEKSHLFSILYRAFDEIFYFLLFSSNVSIEPKIESELQKLVNTLSSE
jgi:Domain of unknown function (DUF4388)